MICEAIAMKCTAILVDKGQQPVECGALAEHQYLELFRCVAGATLNAPILHPRSARRAA